MSKNQTTKRRENKVKKPLMDMVRKLLLWQKKLNSELKGTGYICDLRPKNEEPCVSCKYRKACIHHGWERKFIYQKQSENNKAKRRCKKLAKAEEKDMIKKNLESELMYYPCEPFEFCCPEKDRCNEGQFCPWSEE